MLRRGDAASVKHVRIVTFVGTGSIQGGSGKTRHFFHLRAGALVFVNVLWFRFTFFVSNGPETVVKICVPEGIDCGRGRAPFAPSDNPSGGGLRFEFVCVCVCVCVCAYSSGFCCRTGRSLLCVSVSVCACVSVCVRS